MITQTIKYLNKAATLELQDGKNFFAEKTQMEANPLLRPWSFPREPLCRRESADRRSIAGDSASLRACLERFANEISKML
ncbi:hypothetical protein [Desulfovibrio sp. ZJ200]|uniref:hypothetical protein n=1 Tax=Desulfovibrio sp. ZJ200 TaxID=2709792 RepID=UPI0013ECFCE9|nr:hypothetical protein [Desulfovibrio sp. ZJ200]